MRQEMCELRDGSRPSRVAVTLRACGKSCTDVVLPSLLTIAIGCVATLAAFVAWRWTSVARGARRRDELILRELDPVCERLANGESVAPLEVAALCRKPQLRPMLHQALLNLGRPELFPAEYLHREAEAESVLAYWLMHPNELQAPPERVELVETVNAAALGKAAQFFVFRYSMPAGHWAHSSGWILGLAGPYFEGDKVYENRAAGFSRAGDVVGKVDPNELVRWYADILERKYPNAAERGA
jgi:hypothetical protein